MNKNVRAIAASHIKKQYLNRLFTDSMLLRIQRTISQQEPPRKIGEYPNSYDMLNVFLDRGDAREVARKLLGVCPTTSEATLVAIVVDVFIDLVNHNEIIDPLEDGRLRRLSEKHIGYDPGPLDRVKRAELRIKLNRYVIKAKRPTPARPNLMCFIPSES